MADVFDDLSNVSVEDLPSSFVDRLHDIHRFDANEIQDFLLHLYDTSTPADKKNLLVKIRQSVYSKFVESLPNLSSAELYNRRKLELLANDIFMLGDTVINGQIEGTDKKLLKVLKLKHELRTTDEGNPRNDPNLTTDTASTENDVSLNDDITVPQTTDANVLQVCLQVKDSVNLLTAKLESLTAEITFLKNEFAQKKNQRENTIATNGLSCDILMHDATSSATKEDVGKLISMNESLRETVNKISSHLHEQADELSDEEDEPDEEIIPAGSLLIGDSLLRNVQSDRDDFKVESISGARFCDLKRSLTKMNPRRKKLSNLYIVCGTNDTATKKPCEKIVKDCIVVLQLAKERATNVFLSSITPRIDSKANAQKIDTLNQMLVTTCNDLDVNFVNQDQNFRYRDNSVDETLLLPGDGLHLSQQGVSKLISNFNLQDIIKSSFDFNSPQPVKSMSGHTSLPHCMENKAPPPIETSTQGNAILFKGPKHPLSNLFMSPLYIWNIAFRSVEHAYHYRKAITMNQHTTAEKVRLAHSSFEAMRIGRTIRTDARWKNLKASIMYQLLEMKMEQCQNFRSTLMSTADRSLVEDTSSEYWARGKSGSGLNMLGHLLMTLRDSLARKPHFDDSLPTKPHPHDNSAPHIPRTNNRIPNNTDKQIRCYNCGERSHTAETCRLPSPVLCFSCNQGGHKKKFCQATK